MVNFGGLEISVRASDEFKNRVKCGLKLTASIAAVVLATSTLGSYHYVKIGLDEGYDDPRELEEVIQLGKLRIARDKNAPLLEGYFQWTEVYYGWPGRQINYLIFM